MQPQETEQEPPQQQPPPPPPVQQQQHSQQQQKEPMEQQEPQEVTAPLETQGTESSGSVPPFIQGSFSSPVVISANPDLDLFQSREKTTESEGDTVFTVIVL